MNKGLLMVAIVTVLCLVISLKNHFELNNLYCDLYDSVMAEREYTYPILRKIDNPDNYRKDIQNPITTNSKYLKGCN